MSSTARTNATDRRRDLLVALVLLLLALALRLPGLGNLSFYADEDLSVLSSTGLVETGRSVLPSGMEYRRAFPLTWLNALSIRLTGRTDELAIRLPTALMGALSVPVLFLFGRRWVGFGAGIVAALLMAVSEWHLVFSRQSRMYVPLLLFLLLATWAFWNWTASGKWRDLVLALAATLPGLALHRLGIFLAGAPLVMLAFPGAIVVPVVAVLTVGAVVAVVAIPLNSWVMTPYELLPLPPPVRLVTGVSPPPAVSADPAGFGWVALALAVVGTALAIFAARRTKRHDDAPGSLLRAVAYYGLAAATGIAAGVGQVYAFALAGALLLILGGEGVGPLWRRGRVPLAGLALLVSIHLVVRTIGLGPVEALRASSAFPFPHAFTLAQQAPVSVVLFGLSTLWLVLTPIGPERRGEAAAALLAIGSLAAIGVIREAGPTRYLLSALPFMLLVIGGGLQRAAGAALRRVAGWTDRPALASDGLATGLASALVISGLIGGYGAADAVAQIRLEHGQAVDPMVHMLPFRPDHRSIGRYVREHRRPGDLVVAEDPLVQAWYAGRIDYWFRRYADMRMFLRRHSDGEIRDIYAGSAPLPDPAALDSIARDHPGRVWLLTSGETVYLPQYYLTPEQSLWLDSVRTALEPVVRSEDGRSALYCLNCAPTAPPP